MCSSVLADADDAAIRNDAETSGTAAGDAPATALLSARRDGPALNTARVQENASVQNASCRAKEQRVSERNATKIGAVSAVSHEVES